MRPNAETFYMNIEVVLVLYFIFNFRKNRKFLNINGLNNFMAQLCKALYLTSAKYSNTCKWMLKNHKGKFAQKFELMTNFPI